jgi:hypothetical protein
MNKPTSIEKYNGRNIKRQVWWDGSSDVYDESRAKKGIKMSGWEQGASGRARIDNILDILDYESIVSIYGISDLYNGDYYIQDFNFERRGSQPTMFWWNMILEKET